jgi:hypothetical protein
MAMRKRLPQQCPGCRRIFMPEAWQIEDGPCRDGQLYCPDCLWYDRCGCVTWEMVGHPGAPLPNGALEWIEHPVPRGQHRGTRT